MNPLADMVRGRLVELKTRGVTQTMVAQRARKPDAQSLLSHVAMGLRRFALEDLEAWADGLEYAGADRIAFLQVAKEAAYFLVPSEATRGDDADGLRLWRELIEARSEIAAHRAQLLRAEGKLADTVARVASLERRLKER